MTKEEFAVKLSELCTSPSDSVTAVWVEFAEETAQYHNQYLKDCDGVHDSFTEAMAKRLTQEANLEDLYKAFSCVHQKYGGKMTQLIYLQGAKPECIYPNSFMRAAEYLQNGGSTDQVGELSEDEIFENGGMFWDCSIHDCDEDEEVTGVTKNTASNNAQYRSAEMLKDKIHAEIERAGVGGKRKEMEQIREYVTAYENGPPLIANGLDEGYRILGDFGGHVLAGFKYSGDEAADGYQFATWQYVDEKTAVEHGHYYPTWSFGTNAFDLAKQDFALRSGLVDENFVFNQEQYTQMYEALDFYTRMNDDVLTLKQEENIRKIMSQLERLLPEQPGQEEAIQGPKLGL